jgi:hypothetical protein
VILKCWHLLQNIIWNSRIDNITFREEEIMVYAYLLLLSYRVSVKKECRWNDSFVLDKGVWLILKNYIKDFAKVILSLKIENTLANIKNLKSEYGIYWIKT